MRSESWTSEHQLFVLTVLNFCSSENESYHCIRQSGNLLCIPEKVSFVTNSVCVYVCRFCCCDVWQGNVVIYTTKAFQVVVWKAVYRGSWRWAMSCWISDRSCWTMETKSDNGTSCQRLWQCFWKVIFFVVDQREMANGLSCFLWSRMFLHPSCMERVVLSVCGKWVRLKLTFSGKGDRFFVTVCDLHPHVVG